jgi:Xaa-Pro aminopeptidase
MNLADRAAQVQSFLKPGQGALLTEYRHRVFFLEFPSSAGTILLTPENRYFLVDFRYIEMAGRIENGFQVILQDQLSQQLGALAEENRVTEFFTDVEVLTLESFEGLRDLVAPGHLKESTKLSTFLRELEVHKTEKELANEQEAKKIGAKVEERFSLYVREGISLETLKRKLGELRGEVGDESRTFAAEFQINGEEAGAHDRLKGGDELQVDFEPVIGLTSQQWTMRFLVKGASPIPVQSRQDFLKELLWESGSAILISSRPNLHYYLGRDPGPGGWLFYDGKQILLLGARDPEIPGVDFLPREQWRHLGKVIETEKLRAVYTERGIPLNLINMWKELPCPVIPSQELEERIYRRRSVKGWEEVERIRAAQEITDRVFMEALNYIREGMSDIQIQRMVGVLFYEMGSQMDSFNHVSGCGVDTSLPHVRPSGRIARRGDFVMLDIGAQVEGYGSDMTRMVGIGQVDQEKQDIYQLVLQAQNAAIDAVQPGVVCCEVDGTARKIIDDRGYGQYFLHGLGHPVGCGGREGPRFNQTDASVLHPGVVMTVEPGIYLPGKFGVRIEDMIYVGENGGENLTHSPKELICV